jgi:hypothetical protein
MAEIKVALGQGGKQIQYHSVRMKRFLSSTSSTRLQLEEAVLNGLFL